MTTEVLDVDEHWTFDRKIPIALIVAILIQTCAAIWWMASLTANVSEQQRRLTAVEASLTGRSASDSATLVALTRVQVQVENMSKDIAYVATLKSQLEVMTEAPSQIKGIRRK